MVVDITIRGTEEELGSWATLDGSRQREILCEVIKGESAATRATINLKSKKVEG
jgi:hypothetical protein